MTDAIRELAGLLEQNSIQVNSESSGEQRLVLAGVPVEVVENEAGLDIRVWLNFQSFSLKVEVNGQIQLASVTGLPRGNRQEMDRLFVGRGYCSEEVAGTRPVERSNFVMQLATVTYRRMVKSPVQALAEIRAVLAALTINSHALPSLLTVSCECRPLWRL